MSDSPPLQSLVIRQGKPWQWLCIVVLSGLCCGVTGLYTGSYITRQKFVQTIDKQRLEFEDSTKNLTASYDREFEGVNKNTVLIGQALAGLSGTVATLTERINAVSDRVGAVAATADKHSTQIQQIHATAKVALAKAAVADAKTEVVEAKVDATASMVKAEKPAPARPASVPAATKPAEPRSWMWWTNGTRH